MFFGSTNNFKPQTFQTRNAERCTLNAERGTRNAERGTLNVERGTRNAERGTRNAERGTRNAERETRNTERGTRNELLYPQPVLHYLYKFPGYNTVVKICNDSFPTCFSHFFT